MTPIITVIDSIYDTVIAISIWCIRAFTNTQPRHELRHESTVVEYDTSIDEEATDSPVRTFKTVHEILGREKHAHVESGKNMVMYAGNVVVPLYANPTIEFDMQIASIPYGEMVMMREPKGRFYRIMWNTLEGWVLREDLVDRAVRVHPEFVVGQENSVDDPNTARVRAIIGDAFGIGRSEFSLQAGEYVLYKLWRKGIRIAWPDVRPRTPGIWHKILRGTSNVHIGVTPKIGSVMEYMDENDIGHLAFIEAIFPDETIAVSEANYPDAGIYNERELTKDEWRELKSVFINVR